MPVRFGSQVPEVMFLRSRYEVCLKSDGTSKNRVLVFPRVTCTSSTSNLCFANGKLGAQRKVVLDAF